MNRLTGNHSWDRAIPRPDLNILSDQNLWIPAANGMHPQETLVINVLDEQSNLVTVPREHDTG